MSNWNWLASTRALQESSFDQTFPKHGAELTDYVRDNVLALAAELFGEALQEVAWKPWATTDGWINRDAFVGELVDVGHFLANLLVAADVTDAEWELRYRAKQDQNRIRMANDYDGISGKCPRCRRSYDDGVACRPARTWHGTDGDGQYVSSEPAYCAYAVDQVEG